MASEVRWYNILQGDACIIADLCGFFAAIAFCIFFPDVVLVTENVVAASVGCFPNPNGTGYICP